MQHVHVENITNQQVGARIAEIRVEMKMTQADLASEMTARLGREIRPLTVTRLEGGKRPIGVDELVAAADALKIKPADLLTGNLPRQTVWIISAYQTVIRATNQLEDAVRQYVLDHQRLQDVLAKTGEKHLDRLPPMTRLLIESAANEWTVEFVVNRALNGEEYDDDAEA